MPLPNHVAFRVELAEILANAAALHTRIRKCLDDQQTHHTLADPITDDLNEYEEKQQHFEGELELILDHLVGKYQDTSLSSLEYFYWPGDAEDVANYGQALIDWTSDVRKHLIGLKAKTVKMIRDKEKDSEMPAKDSLPSDFLSYEERLKNVYRSVVKLECWLKIKYKPALLPLNDPQQGLVSSSSSSRSGVIPDTGRISRPKPNDGAALTERLDKIRSTLNKFQTSRPEFSSSLFQIHQSYRLESLRSPFSSESSNIIYEDINNITSEYLQHLLSTAKSGYKQVLTDNEKAFHTYLEQKLHASMGLIQIYVGVTNAAFMSALDAEEGEIIE